MTDQKTLFFHGTPCVAHQFNATSSTFTPPAHWLYRYHPANAQPREHQLRAAVIRTSGQQHLVKQRITFLAGQLVLTIKPVVNNPARPILDTR